MVSGPPLSKRRERKGEPGPDCEDNIPMSKKGEAEGEAEYHYDSPDECLSVLIMLNSDILMQNRMLLCIEIFRTNCMITFICWDFHLLRIRIPRRVWPGDRVPRRNLSFCARDPTSIGYLVYSRSQKSHRGARNTSIALK